MTPRNLAITAVAFLASIGVDAAFGDSRFPGYGATIGLVGCVAIILISKWLGTFLLERPEGWLGIDAPADEHPDLRGADPERDAEYPTGRRTGGGAGD